MGRLADQFAEAQARGTAIMPVRESRVGPVAPAGAAARDARSWLFRDDGQPGRVYSFASQYRPTTCLGCGGTFGASQVSHGLCGACRRARRERGFTCEACGATSPMPATGRVPRWCPECRKKRSAECSRRCHERKRAEKGKEADG